MLGMIAAQSNNYDLAIECFSKAVKENPSIASLHYNNGNALRAEGQLELAIAHYQQALTLEPNWAEVHNNLALVLQEKLFLISDRSREASTYLTTKFNCPHRGDRLLSASSGCSQK